MSKKIFITLALAIGLYGVSLGASNFYSDVSTRHFAYNDIKWADSHDIMMGSEDRFKPYLRVSRAELAQTLQRFDRYMQSTYGLEAIGKPASTIVGLAVETDSLSTLVTAVKAADLVSTLNSSGPFTVFAPTNSAFAALPEGTVDSLLEPDSRSTLTDILTYHVVPSKALSSDLSNGDMIKTVQGDMLKVTIDRGNVYINDAKVVAADIEASNGVVHVIDSVLLP